MNEDTSQSNKPSLLSRVLKVAAYPIAAVTGYWFTKTSIRGSVYDNVRNHQVLDDLRDPVMEEMRVRGRDAAQKAKRGEHVDFFKEVEAIHVNYAAKVDERLEKLTLGTLGQQWKFTQKHQKQQALMNGFTAAAITIGALLSIAHSKTISQTLNHRDDVKPDNQIS
jgi:hypothetical protein